MTISYDDWLGRATIGSVVEDEFNPPAPSHHGPAKRLIIQAQFIRQAISDHLAGKKIITSGLRSPSAIVNGDLHLESFEFPFALFFEGCHFTGDLYVWGMKSGAISFRGSTIDGAMDLRGTDVNGPLLLRDGFVAKGPIIARDMRIRGSVEVVRAALDYDGKSASALRDAAAGQCFGFSRSSAAALYWGEHLRKPASKVGFRDAQVRSFIHDLGNDPPLQSWPQKGGLVLDGFQYDRLAQIEPSRALDWLSLQDVYSASSYSTLAAAFADMNMRQAADDVLQALKKQELNQIRSISRRLFLKFVYWLVSFGQQPVRALVVLLFAMTIHWGIVTFLAGHNGIRPSAHDLLWEECYYSNALCEKFDHRDWVSVSTGGGMIRYLPIDYPKFSSEAFTLESFVPFFDFDQKAYWSVEDDLTGTLLSVIAAFGIFCGGLFLTALTGLLTPKGVT